MILTIKFKKKDNGLKAIKEFFKSNGYELFNDTKVMHSTKSIDGYMLNFRYEKKNEKYIFYIHEYSSIESYRKIKEEVKKFLDILNGEVGTDIKIDTIDCKITIDNKVIDIIEDEY